MNNVFFFFQSHKVLVCITKPFKKQSILSCIYSNTDGSLDAKKKKKKKALYELLLLILA